jgi:hypothetical protein
MRRESENVITELGHNALDHERAWRATAQGVKLMSESFNIVFDVFLKAKLESISC